MKKMSGIFIFFFLLAPVVQAATYTVGNKLPVISIKDQHDLPGQINASTRVILFSRDKAGGEIMTKALQGESKETLTRKQIVYLADISGMPSLISRFVAIPAMQKQDFPMLLDRSGEITTNFPGQDDTATLIYLEALTIKSIVYSDSSAKVRQLLKLD